MPEFVSFCKGFISNIDPALKRLAAEWIDIDTLYAFLARWLWDLRQESDTYVEKRLPERVMVP